MFAMSFLLLPLLTPIAPASIDTTKMVAKADYFAEKIVGDLSGYYICEGQEGPDKKYKGIAVITKKGDMYLMQWVMGSVNFSGVAIRNDTTLAASWAMPVGDKGTIVRGVNMYRIEPGPRLVGRWAVSASDGTIRTETLTFLRKIEDDD